MRSPTRAAAVMATAAALLAAATPAEAATTKGCYSDGYYAQITLTPTYYGFKAEFSMRDAPGTSSVSLKMDGATLATRSSTGELWAEVAFGRPISSNWTLRAWSTYTNPCPATT